MKKKVRKLRKAKATGGYIREPKAVEKITVTKTLVYDKFPVNKYTKFKCEGFIFKFDNNLNPIPVEVPSHIADILLQMIDKGCRCHDGKLKKLFREIK